ncbi:hypothetical protein PQO03_15830 [Lentisphaera profundi]|uniref:L,D-TPase catalytic domain-containing protein n=1 Tax=Lentisphaera profundi TaxID=1658616 RepID=A0ABY7VYG4_9BACT|nr:hypothetical protein [Lentisphaera profundi]WDE99306.1 hypothetical protein PQO03_15830 [Lentisphaera profundi]
MEINYPNSFDEDQAQIDGRTDLGNNIFIHGKDVTIGCIPIGDANIEKLFYLTYLVGISRCKVIISPRDFRLMEKPNKSSTESFFSQKNERIFEALQSFRHGYR